MAMSTVASLTVQTAAIVKQYFYLRANGWAPCHAWQLACELNSSNV